MSHHIPRSLLAGLLIIFLLPLGWSAPTRAADASEPVILVAKPELGDFYRATILLAKPLGDGTHVGFIINRPTQVTLGKLFPDHGPSQQVVEPIYFGGPENLSMIFAIVQGPTNPGGHSLRLTDDLYLAIEADVVDRIIETESDRSRFFAGLVAWQPGELREEVKRGLWYVLDADADLVLRKSSTGLWEELVSRSESARRGI